MRDASPTVVLVPGVGMFSFGKNKTESRITGEFYINAIGVMQGAGALGRGRGLQGNSAGGTGGECGSVYDACELCGAAAERGVPD